VIIDRLRIHCTGVCDVQTLPVGPSGSAHVQLRGAVTLSVRTLSEVESALASGYALRSSASTHTNERSSRSHCIVTLSVSSTHRHTGTRLHGKLHLVDLAGSEDVSRSEVEGQQLRESQNINKSLSALSLVFQALSNKQQHIPYRNSQFDTQTTAGRTVRVALDC
jgi:kinesin family protein C2/C3